MIHPNMATMLAFMTSDAVIGAEALQRLLRQATNHTFNMITVDGDTSTNDMLVAMSSGYAGNEELTTEHPDWDALQPASPMYAKCWPKPLHAMVKGQPSWLR